MTKTTRGYTLRKTLREIVDEGGLPEKISTEAQLWDEIFKKLTYIAPELLLPLIREVHGKSYPVGVKIVPLSTEYSVQRTDTKEIAVIRADVTIIIDDKDIYHFESEISYDGLMAIRMFEYDVHAALTFRSEEQKNNINLYFPHSAVLYLQDDARIPKQLMCTIHFQDGTICTYGVPTVKVQSFSLEEIKEKHLSVLIPFLPIRFRKHIPADSDEKKTPKALEKRKNQTEKVKLQLTSFYREIILILESEIAEGYLSEAQAKTIIQLLTKSMIRISYRNQDVLKEVSTMTEPILELETERYERIVREMKLEFEKEIDQAKEQAKQEAREQAEQQAEQQEREKEEALKKLAAEKEKVIVRLQKRIKELEQQKN